MNLQNVHINHFVHAYKLAPWRFQRQWIGNALLAVVVLAMIAALYLDVTAQAAIAGREIQDLNVAIAISQHASADLQTQLAELTAVTVMEQRAQALGFKPIDPNQAEYLVVAGYSQPQPEILSTATLPQLSAPSIPPEYTQSLLDWANQMLSSSSNGGSR
jgi:hypothetical protein